MRSSQAALKALHPYIWEQPSLFCETGSFRILCICQGLGEVYEEEFVKARAGNTVEDKDEKTRTEAKLLLQSLFAKLDALSHFHFAPKPIIKDMTVQREVPALAMEEVAPQVKPCSMIFCQAGGESMFYVKTYS